MQNSSWLFVVVTLGALGSFDAHACGETSVMSATKTDGKKVELVLDSGVVEKTPAWVPGAGEPPLSIADASEIASAWAAEKYNRFDGIEIREISLTSLGCTSSKAHWYYVFDFTPMMDGNRMYSAGNWAAVLMDGTVVGATEAATTPH